MEDTDDRGLLDLAAAIAGRKGNKQLTRTEFNKGYPEGRKREILRTISGFISLNGYSPSIREIAKKSGLSFESTRKYIVSLEASGNISRQKRRARSIKIIKY
jgi:SOS-response transcriptional repressor LexA